MGRMSEAAVKAMPRRGRLWVTAILALALVALGYTIVEIATKEPGPAVVRAAAIPGAQRLVGGGAQDGARLGSATAPVPIQVFTDLQCGSCREDFLGPI